MMRKEVENWVGGGRRGKDEGEGAEEKEKKKKKTLNCDSMKRS